MPAHIVNYLNINMNEVCKMELLYDPNTADENIQNYD